METTDRNRLASAFEVVPKDGDPVGCIGHWEFEPPDSITNVEDSSGADHNLSEEAV